jgi:GT2 family glycosyltransferase
VSIGKPIDIGPSCGGSIWRSNTGLDSMGEPRISTFSDGIHGQQLCPRQVCVVVLNWNQPDLTIRCVQNILEQDFPAGFVTLVIDNGSTAANVAVLQAGLSSRCILLRNSTNIGFAGGMNIGIEYARRNNFDYVWLLNNDAFPDADCLPKLVAAADADVTVAAISPKLIHPDGVEQPLGSQIDWETGGLYPLPSGPLPKPAPIGCYITGTALLLRTAALDGVNGFDRRFFAYWEDFDLCTQLLQNGWHLSVEESARCVHLGGTSSGINSPLVMHLMARNSWLFIRKYQRRAAWPRLWLRQAAVQLIHAGNLDGQGSRPQAMAVVSALWAGLTGTFDQPKRLTLPNAVGEPILRHFWGIARLMWALANMLAKPAFRRAPLTNSDSI